MFARLRCNDVRLHAHALTSRRQSLAQERADCRVFDIRGHNLPQNRWRRRRLRFQNARQPMNDDARTTEALLADDWQVWLVLRHLLPARLLRTLVRHIVAEVSSGQVALEDLFEEVHSDQPIWSEAWIVRPR